MVRSLGEFGYIGLWRENSWTSRHQQGSSVFFSLVTGFKVAQGPFGNELPGFISNRWFQSSLTQQEWVPSSRWPSTKKSKEKQCWLLAFPWSGVRVSVSATTVLFWRQTEASSAFFQHELHTSDSPGILQTFSTRLGLPRWSTLWTKQHL